jgi:hypothetical protein
MRALQTALDTCNQISRTIDVNNTTEMREIVTSVRCFSLRRSSWLSRLLTGHALENTSPFNALFHALLNEPVWRYRIALFATLLFVLPPWSIISCVVTLIRLSHSECTVFSGDRHQVLVPLGRPDGGPRHQRRQKGTPHAAAVVMFAIALFCSLLWWLCIGVIRCRRLRSFCAGGMRRGETVWVFNACNRSLYRVLSLWAGFQYHLIHIVVFLLCPTSSPSDHSCPAVCAGGDQARRLHGGGR